MFKKMKAVLKKVRPSSVIKTLKIAKERLRFVRLDRELKHVKQAINEYGFNDKRIMEIFDKHDLNISKSSDYYSPLPVLSKLERNASRWIKPSALAGIAYDMPQMKNLFLSLMSKYSAEYGEIPDYYENIEKGYGPGYNAFDAMILYFMIRENKPRRCIEIGSGISTYYCSLAARRIREEGKQLKITCVEPFPYDALYGIPQIEVIKKEVQDIDVSFFEQLESGDVLFIDSTHIVKIDGDVPYLFLEVIPRLKKGVIIHIHDIPFPYNIPFPPQLWVFGKIMSYFWNEAMLLQAFLCYNDAYRIIFSAPILRFYEETFLSENVPNYESISKNPDTFSSIWIEKVK